MKVSPFLQLYKDNEGTIKSLYGSSTKLAILDALYENKPHRLSDLRYKLNLNAPNTSANCKGLMDLGLVEKPDGDYTLTEWGELVLERIKEELQFYSSLNKFREYWDSHILSGLPEEFRQEIGLYATAVLLKPKADVIDYPDRRWIELYKGAKKRLWGVTPVFRDDYMEAIMQAINNNAKVQLIFTKEILDSMLSKIPKDQISKLRSMKNLQFFLIEDLSIAFTIGDDFCTIGFKSKKGPSTYMDMCIESWDPKCVQFQLRLFDYFKKKSTAVKL